MMYEFLTGQTPFKGKTAYETYDNIKNVRGLKFKPNFDPKAHDLITRLLLKEPQTRIGASDINEIKEHPFFEAIDWDGVRLLNPPYVPKEKKRRFRNPKQSLSQIEVQTSNATKLSSMSPTAVTVTSPLVANPDRNTWTTPS